ncbi:MAG TPA: hypothetical protein VF128_04835 [Gemmatimonadaceae bacterium]
MIDHRTRFVLGVIAIALCAIALRLWLPVPSAEAQTPAQQPPKPPKAAYEFLEVEQGGTDGIYQLKDKLDGMAGKGWHAKSIAVTDNATVILLEKLE